MQSCVLKQMNTLSKISHGSKIVIINRVVPGSGKQVFQTSVSRPTPHCKPCGTYWRRPESQTWRNIAGAQRSVVLRRTSGIWLYTRQFAATHGRWKIDYFQGGGKNNISVQIYACGCNEPMQMRIFGRSPPQMQVHIVANPAI